MADKAHESYALFSTGPGALVNLDGFTGEITLGFRTRFDERRLSGRTHISRFPLRSEATLGLSAVLYGERARAIRDAAAVESEANAAVAMAVFPRGVLFGGVHPEGFELRTPYDAVVVANSPLPSDGPWYGGDKQELMIDSANAVALARPAGWIGSGARDIIGIAVSGTAPNEAATLVVNGDRNSAPVPLRPGIYIVDSPANPVRLTPSARPSASASVIVGYGVRIGANR